MLRPKPILYVALCDRDQWAVEAEWPDGTLERIDTFNDHSSATDWITTQSDVWLEERRTPNKYPLRKPARARVHNETEGAASPGICSAPRAGQFHAAVLTVCRA